MNKACQNTELEEMAMDEIVPEQAANQQGIQLREEMQLASTPGTEQGGTTGTQDHGTSNSLENNKGDNSAGTNWPNAKTKSPT